MLDRLSRIQDAFMREHGLNYFENSRRASYAQQKRAEKSEWL